MQHGPTSPGQAFSCPQQGQDQACIPHGISGQAWWWPSRPWLAGKGHVWWMAGQSPCFSRGEPPVSDTCIEMGLPWPYALGWSSAPVGRGCAWLYFPRRPGQGTANVFFQGWQEALRPQWVRPSCWGGTHSARTPYLRSIPSAGFHSEILSSSSQHP